MDKEVPIEHISKEELLRLLDAVGVKYHIDESTPPVFQDVDGTVMPLDQAPSTLEILASADIFDDGITPAKQPKGGA